MCYVGIEVVGVVVSVLIIEVKFIVGFRYEYRVNDMESGLVGVREFIYVCND